MNDGSTKILDLRPVTFNYKTNNSKSKHYGLIAEEVDEVMKELVIYKDEQPETVAYHTLNILLLNEVQKLNKKIIELENRLPKNN